MKRLETANRMRWHDAKTDPPEDSRDVIVYRDGIGSVMGFFDHEIHKGGWTPTPAHFWTTSRTGWKSRKTRKNGRGRS